MKKIILFSLMAIIAGCASQQKVSTIEDTARIEADATTARTLKFYQSAAKDRQSDYVTESRLPLLSGDIAPIKRVLPSSFRDSYFYVALGESRLVDVLKRLSSDTGILVTARDDVYNPTSTKIETKSDNGSIAASAVGIADKIRTEGNLDVADRIKLPAGARFEGDVEGFFDYVSSLLNISWSYIHDEGRVVMTRYTERSYSLFIPPNQEGGEDSGDIWSDTETTILNMLSQGGSVQVNQKTGSISVLDTKDVHNMVKKYITKTNSALQKSVVFKLEVLAVATTDSDREGLDMSFINTGDGSARLGGGGISIPGAAGIAASVLTGPFTGSSFIAQNLSKQGEVTTGLSRIIKSLSNQTASISKIDTIPVISTFTPPTIIDGVVTPGAVSLEDIEVGFDLKLTPSIMNDGQNLVVRLALETSNIAEIIDIQVGNNGQFVQSARRTARAFEHVFPMRNAETIVISGFYDEINNFAQSGSSNSWLSWLFSSKDDVATRNHYVILLTPDVSNGTGVTY